MFTRKKDELGQRQGSLGRKLTAEPWYWSVRKPKKDELERCQGSLGRKLAAGPWLGQFANPRLRKDLTAVQTRGVLTAPTHQSLTP
jgi:hypothetical protein